jgi:hypothetical protein
VRLFFDSFAIRNPWFSQVIGEESSHEKVASSQVKLIFLLSLVIERLFFDSFEILSDIYFPL